MILSLPLSYEVIRWTRRNFLSLYINFLSVRVIHLCLYSKYLNTSILKTNKIKHSFEKLYQKLALRVLPGPPNTRNNKSMHSACGLAASCFHQFLVFGNLVIHSHSFLIYNFKGHVFITLGR
jgi:hypothetical protein